MKTFEKIGNENFTFESKMPKGFIKKTVSTANGLSEYYLYNVTASNTDKLPYELAEVIDRFGNATVKVRASYHESGLEKNCGGICGTIYSKRAFEIILNLITILQ